MKKWDYDGSIYRFPIQRGELWTCEHGSLAVNDLYTGIPAFMEQADCIFVDPPWNVGNENSFRTKAGIEQRSEGFDVFVGHLFAAIDRINPKVLFVEMGKQAVDLFEEMLKERYEFVDRYESTYYHNKDKPCFILRGANTPPTFDYNGMDEEDVIRAICEREEFDTIGDVCMGRGFVGYYAFLNKRRFVGTELNPNRLAVLISRIDKKGGTWNVSRLEPQPG